MKRLEGIRSSLVGVAGALGVALFLISLHGCDRPAAPVLELPSTVAVIARPRPTHANVGAASLRGPAPVEPNAVIVGDIDGDTVIVDIGGRSEHLRLLGIDTPETHRPGTPIECYGPEASAFTAAL